MVPRGIRNNNPGNVRISPTHWLGKITPSADPEFETFDKMEHGIRAIAKILHTYFAVDNLSTIRQIISRWAPPADDNPTDAYITHVADATGFDPDSAVDLTDADDLLGVVEAIITQENGGLFGITADQILAGVKMAMA